jgi:hypothetical protein
MQLVQKENDLHYLLDLKDGRERDGRREWMARRNLFLESLLTDSDIEQVTGRRI